MPRITGCPGWSACRPGCRAAILSPYDLPVACFDLCPTCPRLCFAARAAAPFRSRSERNRAWIPDAPDLGRNPQSGQSPSIYPGGCFRVRLGHSLSGGALDLPDQGHGSCSGCAGHRLSVSAGFEQEPGSVIRALNPPAEFAERLYWRNCLEFSESAADTIPPGQVD